MTSMTKIAALALLTLSACGTARLGQTNSYGGKVLLEGSYMPSMTEARYLMGMHCGSPYQVIEKSHRVEFRCDPQDRATIAVAKR